MEILSQRNGMTIFSLKLAQGRCNSSHQKRITTAIHRHKYIWAEKNNSANTTHYGSLPPQHWDISKIKTCNWPSGELKLTICSTFLLISLVMTRHAFCPYQR